MYKTPELIKKVKLKEIPVPNQEKILAETGSPLDLQQAYEIIKEISQDFKLYDEKAIEADELLASLIERTLKESLPTSTIVEEKESKEVEKENNAIEKSSAARKRKLQLLKMKLQLEKEKKTQK